MTAHLEAATEILTRLRDALGHAADAQHVLDVIVSELQPCFPLDRATIRRLDEDMLEIVAIWSAEPTALGIGARMRALSSSLPTIVETGRPVVRTRIGPRKQLLEQVVASEGIASFVTMPLRVAGRIRGLLSFSSRAPDAFSEEDLPFLERVAEIVEVRAAGSLAG